jgi:hypothetical protein
MLLWLDVQYRFEKQGRKKYYIELDWEYQKLQASKIKGKEDVSLCLTNQESRMEEIQGSLLTVPTLGSEGRDKSM